jgi:hypothetical protein
MSVQGRSAVRAIMLGAACVALSGAVLADGVTGYKQGQGGSPVQGAAGTAGSTGDKGLEHCDKPMGAVAVVEPQTDVMQMLSHYGMSSPVSLIRMMVQQSNCFLIVERGIAMQNMQQERALANSGELRSNSNMGKGQMVSADFILTPSVIFSESDAGGLGGLIGGAIPHHSSLIGAVAGGLKFKEAQTSMLLADARSGVQVAAAEGSTRKADLKLGVGFLSSYSSVAGGVGGYGNTNEGKIVAAAFLDNYNKVVDVVRGDASLQRSVGTLKEEAAAKTKAGVVYNEGDVVHPKIANVKMLASPADGAKSVATLKSGAELVVIGEAKDGYVNVQGTDGEGWVKAVLLKR